MRNLHLRINGSEFLTCGGLYQLNGSNFCSQISSLLHLSQISKVINHVSVSRVTTVSKLNTNYKFTNKELPDRAAISAHWSGPFVAARQARI